MGISDRAKILLRRLKETYSRPGPFARWENPFQLAVVTMLSAQCTDERVDTVAKSLFQKYPTPLDIASAPVADLEKAIYSTGYYRSKARYLKGIGKRLIREFEGQVPETFEDLIRLPGISKKSACIIGAKAFGKFYGVAVDTHVARLAPRLGLTKSTNREMIAKDLERLFPSKEYLNVNEYFITHGRAVCIPRIPRCAHCVLREMCPSASIFLHSIVSSAPEKEE